MAIKNGECIKEIIKFKVYDSTTEAVTIRQFEYACIQSSSPLVFVYEYSWLEWLALNTVEIVENFECGVTRKGLSALIRSRPPWNEKENINATAAVKADQNLRL